MCHQQEEAFETYVSSPDTPSATCVSVTGLLHGLQREKVTSYRLVPFFFFFFF